MFFLVGGIIGFSMFIKTPRGRSMMDSFKIHVFLFGKLFQKLYVSRFARTAEMMLATGVTMIDSVKIATEATSNVVVEKEFSKAIEIIKAGKPLSEALEDRQYMLPLVPQMASIGEQSGKMDEMLGKAAQVFEDDLDEKVQAISSAIEPVMMILLAILAGGLVGGILFPIYALVNEIA